MATHPRAAPADEASHGAAENAAADGPEVPRPWSTREDSNSWRARPRAQRGTGAAAVALKQSVLVELDDDDLEWLERESTRTGLTLSACVKLLIADARTEKR